MKSSFFSLLLLLSLTNIWSETDSSGFLARWKEERVSEKEIVIQGVKRIYFVHTPKSGSSKPLPVVFVFHGGGGNAARMPAFTGFNTLADQNGFLVVYPNGLDHHWNDGREGAQKTSDVEFIVALLDQLGRDYFIDPHRIYATGMSNGGFFSLRIAWQLSSRFAAVASVAATLPVALLEQDKTPQPISVMMINGTDDPLVPFRGGWMKIGQSGNILSFADSIALWVKQDGCNPKPSMTSLPDRDPNDGTTVQCTVYSAGKNDTEVIGYTIQGGGHTWPGGKPYLPEKIIGKTCHDFNASEVIWEFFSRHRKP